MKDSNYDIQHNLSEYVKDYPDKEIRIINAAINSFSEKGFKDTKTKEIASRAHIAEGTIFRYFPSKEAILERMVPLLVRVMQPKLEKPVMNIIRETEGSSADVVFTFIIVDRLKMIRDNQRFIKSVLPELIHRAPLLNQLKESVFPMIETYISQVIEAAKKRGEISASVRSDIVMYQLVGFIFSYSMLSPFDDEARIKEDVQHYMRYAMKGWQQ